MHQRLRQPRGDVHADAIDRRAAGGRCLAVTLVRTTALAAIGHLLRIPSCAHPGREPVVSGVANRILNVAVGIPRAGVTDTGRPQPQRLRGVRGGDRPGHTQRHHDARDPKPSPHPSKLRPTRAPVPLHLADLPGRLAQLGERRLDKAEVAGSSPASSTPDSDRRGVPLLSLNR